MKGGMKGAIGALVLGSLLVASAPGLAGAQARGYVGIGGGATVPIGDFADGVKTGWLAQVIGGVAFKDGLLGVRVNGTYGQNKEKDPSTHTFKMIGAMGDVVISPRMSGNAHPYVLAGAGVVNGKSGDSSGDTNFGWNVGAGVEFAVGSLGVYFEGRFQQVRESGHSANMIPITAGVRIGGGGGQ